MHSPAPQSQSRNWKVPILRKSRLAVCVIAALKRKCAMVKLDGTFPDGSYRVVLVLRNGREMKGRLYKERNRLKIAVDVISVFES